MVLARGITEILLRALTRGIPEFSKNRILPPPCYHCLCCLPPPSLTSATAPKHPPPTSPFAPPSPLPLLPSPAFARRPPLMPTVATQSPKTLPLTFVVVVAVMAWGMAVADWVVWQRWRTAVATVAAMALNDRGGGLLILNSMVKWWEPNSYILLYFSCVEQVSPNTRTTKKTNHCPTSYLCQ